MGIKVRIPGSWKRDALRPFKSNVVLFVYLKPSNYLVCVNQPQTRSLRRRIERAWFRQLQAISVSPWVFGTWWNQMAKEFSLSYGSSAGRPAWLPAQAFIWQPGGGFPHQPCWGGEGDGYLKLPLRDSRLNWSFPEVLMLLHGRKVPLWNDDSTQDFNVEVPSLHKCFAPPA